MRNETRTARLTRGDWALLGVSVFIIGGVIFLMLDPEPSMRRASYYRGLADSMQSLAYHIGKAGLEAEREYHRIMELERIN